MWNAYVDFDAADFDGAIRIGPGGWPGLRADFLFRSHVTPICAPAFLEANRITAPADLLNVERLAPNDPWWAGWLAEAGVDVKPPPPPGADLDSHLQEAPPAQDGCGIAPQTPPPLRGAPHHAP